MKTITVTRSVRGLWLAKKFNVLALALAVAVSVSTEVAGQDARAPEMPAVCEAVNVTEGYRVSFRAYALGVQIYAWDGSEWIFKGPEAGLYADAGYHGQIGIHYGGPTWEANDGSKVQAAVAARCNPYPGAIPWLLLQSTATQGRGLFARITRIQRVNTIGGKAPAQPGTVFGEEARVPYTAEYYFYRTRGN